MVWWRAFAAAAVTEVYLTNSVGNSSTLARNCCWPAISWSVYPTLQLLVFLSFALPGCRFPTASVIVLDRSSSSRSPPPS
eukprot:9904076-Lingulodinium_polyedra.AAC.1